MIIQKAVIKNGPNDLWGGRRQTVPFSVILPCIVDGESQEKETELFLTGSDSKNRLVGEDEIGSETIPARTKIALDYDETLGTGIIYWISE